MPSDPADCDEFRQEVNFKQCVSAQSVKSFIESTDKQGQRTPLPKGNSSAERRGHTLGPTKVFLLEMLPAFHIDHPFHSSDRAPNLF